VELEDQEAAGEKRVSLNLSKIHPTLKTIARNLPRVAASQGFQVRITSGYRSYATQAKLYKDYISGVAAYPANPPGQSKHEKGLALDVLSTNTEGLANLMTSVGLVWAGPSDPIHFEMPAKSSRTGKVTTVSPTPAKKKKSLAKSVLGVTSWIPGPVGIASTVLDFIF
jgi:hypothetical protein